MTNLKHILLMLFTALFLTACGGDDSSENNSNNNNDSNNKSGSIFPTTTSNNPHIVGFFPGAGYTGQFSSGQTTITNGSLTIKLVETSTSVSIIWDGTAENGTVYNDWVAYEYNSNSSSDILGQWHAYHDNSTQAAITYTYRSDDSIKIENFDESGASEGETYLYPIGDTGARVLTVDSGSIDVIEITGSNNNSSVIMYNNCTGTVSAISGGDYSSCASNSTP